MLRDGVVYFLTVRRQLSFFIARRRGSLFDCAPAGFIISLYAARVPFCFAPAGFILNCATAGSLFDSMPARGSFFLAAQRQLSFSLCAGGSPYFIARRQHSLFHCAPARFLSGNTAQKNQHDEYKILRCMQIKNEKMKVSFG